MQKIEQVSSYKYLGVVVDETLSFSECLEELAASGSRALGAVINKCRTHRDLGFKTYDKLINSCVFSILDYGAEVTGFRMHQSLIDVQNRAARYFLGVNRFCPLPCLNMELGWLSSLRRRNLSVIRFYNRIQKMDSDRLPKRLFVNTKQNTVCWANRIKGLLDELYLGHYWETNSVIPEDIYTMMVREKCKEELFAAIDQKVKLRTYRTFCVGLTPSAHVKCNMNKSTRSLLSQLRCGILHLRIETGRFNRELLQDRICRMCNLNQVESETHFIFDCPAYVEDRRDLISALKLQSFPQSFMSLFQHPFVFGKFVKRIWRKRCEHQTS